MDEYIRIFIREYNNQEHLNSNVHKTIVKL